jgi:hypothetical protein
MLTFETVRQLFHLVLLDPRLSLLKRVSFNAITSVSPLNTYGILKISCRVYMTDHSNSSKPDSYTAAQNLATLLTL